MPPTLAAIAERGEKAAVVTKAVGGASVHAASTVSTVLWESRADVDDRAGSDGDGRVDAAGGAAATILSGFWKVPQLELTWLHMQVGGA